MNEVLSTALIAVILIAVFLIGRQFFTWYWKINKIIENQEEQIHYLKIIAGVDLTNSKHSSNNMKESEAEKKARLYDDSIKKDRE
jgi:hypothetical protein